MRAILRPGDSPRFAVIDQGGAWPQDGTSDEHGRGLTIVAAATGEGNRGISGDASSRVVKSWARWEQAGGWHAASGLPKPQELTVTAGSPFLIHPERTVDDSALQRLGARGLGLRRHEGFGDLAPPPRLRRDA